MNLSLYYFPLFIIFFMPRCGLWVHKVCKDLKQLKCHVWMLKQIHRPTLSTLIMETQHFHYLFISTLQWRKSVVKSAIVLIYTQMYLFIFFIEVPSCYFLPPQLIIAICRAGSTYFTMFIVFSTYNCSTQRFLSRARKQNKQAKLPV